MSAFIVIDMHNNGQCFGPFSSRGSALLWADKCVASVKDETKLEEFNHWEDRIFTEDASLCITSRLVVKTDSGEKSSRRMWLKIMPLENP